MCRLCLRTPCIPQCPNAEEPHPVYYCSKCGKSIFVGNRVFISPQDDPICERCVDNMTGKELMHLLGESMEMSDEMLPVHACSKCGGNIFTGDKEFIAPQDGPICEDCVENMSGKEMMKLLEETMDTVEENY